ncbi:hypothetical protein TWF481_007608 [Arthrobotrys musiformis]|uniref:Zn(2)-C6 fungal-type domain-containing protein n=1 Tax=Arthrobotrys musiformis TaxID=47236 RepID=A0AAV9WDX5_9PEZI
MSFPSLTPNLNNGADGLKIWSCTNCRRRKVRCDRRDPCIHCAKNNAECTFPIAGRVPRRIRGVAKLQKIAPKHEELLSRLRNLEDMVSQLGSQVENAAIGDVSNAQDGIDTLPAMEDVVQLETPSASSGSLSEQTQSNTPQESDAMILENNGELVVGDRFWTIFCGEVERIFEAARGPEPYSFEIHNDSTAVSDTSARSHINYYNFLLRQADAAAKYDLVHPHPSQLLLLWQTYVDDIDPFIKIIHVPSMTRIIRDLRGQYHHLKPTTEALIFAISLAAVSVSTEEDISQHFNISKQELCSRYRLCTEQTFEKIGLLTSDSLESLQALAIYIYTLRSNQEQKLIWALSGVLLRISLRLNLQNESKNPTITTALERECRRRLWWQTCLTDSASNHEISGVSNFLVSEDMFDAPMPSNIDDADINNTATLDLQIRGESRRTDLTIFLIRCEIWRLSRRLQTILATAQPTLPRNSTSETPIDLFETARTKITQKYLNYLRDDIPLDNFVRTTTHLFFAKVELRLLTHHLIHPNQRHKTFTLANSILNYTHTLQYEPSFEPWRWHIQDPTAPYYALSIILTTISTQQWDPKFEEALTSAIRTVTTIPEGTPQHSHFTKLLATAQSRSRDQATQTSTSSISIQSNSNLSTSANHPPLTPEEFAPIYSNDFDFTMFADNSVSRPINFETWDDMIDIYDPWEFGNMGGI